MPIDSDCEKIANLIADYRYGEIPPATANHVGRWIDQFPASVREPLLAEVAHLLSQTYVSRAKVEAFLRRVATSESFVGDDAVAFWRGVRFLQLQTAGNSQRDMLALFGTTLKNVFGLSIEQCNAKPHTYVYLDDGVFSGGRVKSDVMRWIKEDAPQKAKVAIIVMAVHSLGEYFAIRTFWKQPERQARVSASSGGEVSLLRIERAIWLSRMSCARKAFRLKHRLTS